MPPAIRFAPPLLLLFATGFFFAAVFDAATVLFFDPALLAAGLLETAEVFFAVTGFAVLLV